jgi:hypothetical protein
VDERVRRTLRDTIDALSGDAKVLLVRALNETMKDHVRTAQSELAEAMTLLDQYNTSVVTHLFGVVESAIQSATLRLQMVEHALQTRGADANEID